MEIYKKQSYIKNRTTRSMYVYINHMKNKPNDFIYNNYYCILRYVESRFDIYIDGLGIILFIKNVITAK
jgi:hypothetical protein